MSNFARKISLVFAAGCLGGLINSLAVWIFGELGISSAMGVSIAPELSPGWLYPRLGRDLGTAFFAAAHACEHLCQRSCFQHRSHPGAAFLRISDECQ
jgi:hypothetical protein